MLINDGYNDDDDDDADDDDDDDEINSKLTQHDHDFALKTVPNRLKIDSRWLQDGSNLPFKMTPTWTPR